MSGNPFVSQISLVKIHTRCRLVLCLMFFWVPSQTHQLIEASWAGFIANFAHLLQCICHTWRLPGLPDIGDAYVACHGWEKPVWNNGCLRGLWLIKNRIPASWMIAIPKILRSIKYHLPSSTNGMSCSHTWPKSALPEVSHNGSLRFRWRGCIALWWCGGARMSDSKESSGTTNWCSWLFNTCASIFKLPIPWQ